MDPWTYTEPDTRNILASTTPTSSSASRQRGGRDAAPRFGVLSVRLYFIGRGATSASVRPRLHFNASKYMRETSGLSQVAAAWPNDE